MAYTDFPYDNTRRFCRDTFLARGFSPAQCDIIVDVLLLADLFGIESHGIQRLILYHRSLDSGLIHVNRQPQTVFETPLSAVIDANDAMGQLAGHQAMQLAIEKAEKTGVGLVCVRNSNHYGIAGYYTLLAEKKGLLGICMTNSEAILVPTHGKQPMLGTNPIAVCMPAEPVPFWFDAATTVVPRGKLEVYNKRGDPLPPGWAVDENGHDTTDGNRVIDNINQRRTGGQLPLGGSSELTGGHKGYGYAMLVEICTSILAGAPTSGHTYENGRCMTSQFFAAMDPGLFGDREALKARLSSFLEEIRQSAKADGQTRIYTHGEKEWEKREWILRHGIPASDKTVDEMRWVAERMGLSFEAYFPKEE